MLRDQIQSTRVRIYILRRKGGKKGKDRRKQSRKKAVKMIENVLTADLLYSNCVCRKVLSSTQDFGMRVSLR